MNTLHKALRDYAMLRRSLGFKFREQEQILKYFVSFMSERGARCITTQLAFEWAVQPTHAKPSRWAQRLSYVRGFARYLQAEHPDTEIPATPLFPAHFERAKPHVYTQEEITRLMSAAKAFSPGNKLPGLSYHCLFGLLTVTGLRIGEALALTHDNVDLEEGILTIRAAKFGRSRLVPLHRSTQRMLRCYVRRRDALLGEPRSPYFLVAQEGGGQPFASPFTSFRVRSDCEVHPTAAGRLCMTSATDLPSRHCCAGIGPDRISRFICRFSARTLAILTSTIRIGICPPAQNS